MRGSLRSHVQNPGVLVADGALGTMLLRRGLTAGDCPERMNLDHPEVLREIARLYLEAGACIIQTNTFGASPLKLVPYGLERSMKEINCRAVAAVRDVIGEQAYLSASCGPCGRLLEPYGDMPPEKVYESFRKQIEVLIAEGVDMICIETMIDLSEATLAVKAARSVSSSVPISAALTFDSTPAGFFTIMGTSPARAAESLCEAGADIIGSNCGNGLLTMIRIAEEFKAATHLPLIIQSNAGVPVLRDGVPVYLETPAFMAEHIGDLVQMGVKIIGGCCGTTPEHIAAISRVVHSQPVERRTRGSG